MNTPRFKNRILGPSILAGFILALGAFFLISPPARANDYFYAHPLSKAELRQLLAPPSFSFGAVAARAGIGLPGPIYAKTRIRNGERVCAKKHAPPEKSRQNSTGHIDTECCLDPGEIPNSNCYYPLQKYGALINKYLAEHPQL